MKEKIIKFTYERLRETSTWTGLGFVLTALGCKFAADLPWEQATGFGCFVSAGIKMVFPDIVKKIESVEEEEMP